MKLKAFAYGNRNTRNSVSTITYRSRRVANIKHGVGDFHSLYRLVEVLVTDLLDKDIFGGFKISNFQTALAWSYGL